MTAEKVLVWLAVIVVGLVALLVGSPYLKKQVVTGGSAREVALQNVDPSEYGTFFVLRVHERTRWEALIGRSIPAVDTTMATKPLGVAPAGNWTDDAIAGENAWIAASRFVGLDTEKVPYLRVLRAENYQSSEHGYQPLEDGDLLIEIDGRSALMGEVYQLQQAKIIVQMVVLRDEEILTLKVDPNAVGYAEQLYMDPTNHPVPGTPETEKGESSGLVHALALVDAVGEGDLTGGLRVAATGTLDGNGSVGEIGGVVEKTRAAIKARADVLFVPPGNEEAARQAAGDDITVVPVAHLFEAVQWLCGNSPEFSLCQRALDASCETCSFSTGLSLGGSLGSNLAEAIKNSVDSIYGPLGPVGQ